jgi:hypothetical protein
MAKSHYAQGMKEAQNPKSTGPQAGDKYIVRFPEGVRDRIAEAAKANNRSMNAEIIDRLDRSFAPGEGYATKAQLERVFSKIAEEQALKDDALQLVREMLARTVIQIYQALPPESPARPGNVLGYQLAESVSKPAAPGLEDILFKWVNDDSKQHAAVVQGMASVIRATARDWSSNNPRGAAKRLGETDDK